MEVESQVADLQTYVNKRTRYSERVNLINFLLVLAGGVMVFVAAYRMFGDHKSRIDEAVKVVFFEPPFRSGAPDDSVTVQRGKLTRALADHVTIEMPMIVIYLLLGGMYLSAIVNFFVHRRGTRHLVQAMGIITQLQGQSSISETT